MRAPAWAARTADVTDAAGILTEFGNGLGVAWADHDGDGRLDIYVANDAMPNQLWRNTGAEGFEDVAVRLGCAVNGAGAAGRAIAFLLGCHSGDTDQRVPVGKIRVCDSKGILWPGRPGQNPTKEEIARVTNPEAQQGDLRDALRGADVFIGVSRGNLLVADDIRSMAKDPIVFAMANPTPEIDPEEARAGGAVIVGTGRSDYPNQVNNVLAFPGLFRGALEARARKFNAAMKLAAVSAIVDCVQEPTPGRILPAPFNRSVAPQVAAAVRAAAETSGVCRN